MKLGPVSWESPPTRRPASPDLRPQYVAPSCMAGFSSSALQRHIASALSHRAVTRREGDLPVLCGMMRMLGRDFDSDDAEELRGCAASLATTMMPERGGRAVP